MEAIPAVANILVTLYDYPMEKLEMSMHLSVKNKLFIMYGLSTEMIEELRSWCIKRKEIM